MWMYIMPSPSKGLAEQWLFRLNEQTIGQIVKKGEKDWHTVMIGPGHTVASGALFNTELEDVKLEVEATLRDMGWSWFDGT